uniref:asparagine synthase-related protein n=1 Tax=uncultured Erythrobacter sp. TaxID=263913 RepID=UPI00261B065E|nr:asparagine synthase-related protein [uncultured Erythrobacter sp.]
MSGFAIEYRRDGSAASIESANRMKVALQVFGSDRRDIKVAGPFAISWVQSAGFAPQDRHDFQPVIVGDRWHLVFLGRLNRRKELAETLGLSPKDLERTPDSALAMMAWEKWGEACRDNMYGGFSLIVCDSHENSLTAIRSYERSQHIFYYVDADRIILSTSPKGIFAFPEIPRTIDEIKIADMLVLNHQDTQRSFFEGVSVLGQAHTMFVRSDQPPVVAHHDYLNAVQPIRFAKDEDYIERANELLDEALESAFRSAGPPAISLSAGLDSTALAVAMIERMRRDGTAEPGALKAFTAVPVPEWDGRVRSTWLGDESGPVKALAEMYPELDVTFVSSQSLAFDQEVDMIQSYADMPVRGVGTAAWGSALKQACREGGVKVLSSGSAGNGTTSFAASHILFAKWLRRGNWAKFLREMRMFVAKRPGASMRSVIGQAGITNLPDALYDAYFKHRGFNNFSGYEAYTPIHPDYARDIGVKDRIEEHGADDRFRRLPDRQESLRRFMQYGARNDGAGLIEPERVMSGVESVCAYEDRRLIEFCYAIPDDQFYRDGVDRRLIKQMMKGKLPKEVLNAPRGEQSSDWHFKTKQGAERIIAELDRLADIPSIATRLDIPRMKRVYEELPDETPISADEYSDYSLARYGLGRAISVARFINQVEGRN